MNATETAARNDQIRALLPVTHRNDRFVMTAGLAAMGGDVMAEAMRKVKAQTDFEPGNDPYGERDFGSFELSTGDKCFWKIDDYQGHDGIRCVMTVMLADEY